MSLCCAPPPAHRLRRRRARCSCRHTSFSGGVAVSPASRWPGGGQAGPPASSPDLLPECLLLGLQPQQDTRTVRAGTASVPEWPPRPSATRIRQTQRPLSDARQEGGAACLASIWSGARRSYGSPFWADGQEPCRGRMRAGHSRGSSGSCPSLCPWCAAAGPTVPVGGDGLEELAEVCPVPAPAHAGTGAGGPPATLHAAGSGGAGMSAFLQGTSGTLQTE